MVALAENKTTGCTNRDTMAIRGKVKTITVAAELRFVSGHGFTAWGTTPVRIGNRLHSLWHSPGSHWETPSQLVAQVRIRARLQACLSRILHLCAFRR